MEEQALLDSHLTLRNNWEKKTLIYCRLYISPVDFHPCCQHKIVNELPIPGPLFNIV